MHASLDSIRRLGWITLVILSQALPRVHAAAQGTAEHVVMIVWDGMRPDFIRPQYAPNLSKLANEGVFFQNHHPVYVSSTEVNGTALATGCYPEHTGIMANTDYRPEIGWQGPTGTETLEAIRRGDLLTGGNYIAVPTVAEILHQAGHPTAVAGTKPIAMLHDRSAKRTLPAAADSFLLYRGKTIPQSALATIVKEQENKDFPGGTNHPNTAQDEWTTKALTRTFWKKGVPKFSVLWLSDPDGSQHETGPGSEVSVNSIQSVDKCLGMVTKALEDKKVLSKTDIIVVSDHGFSTIARGIELTNVLNKAGFKTTKKFEDPEPGETLVVGLGGSAMLYVTEHDEKTIHGLVDFFQASDIAGVIFSRLPIEGTFPLEQVRIGKTNTPDLLVSFRWSAEKNEFGTPGTVTAEGGKKGRGTHASLSKYDMNNTLVASGPDFRKGMVNTLPSGNADVAPTILWILGVPQPQPMDGRVLAEALLEGPGPVPKVQSKTIEAKRNSGAFEWRQYLKYSTVGSAIYFDEGNGDSVLRTD